MYRSQWCLSQFTPVLLLELVLFYYRVRRFLVGHTFTPCLQWVRGLSPRKCRSDFLYSGAFLRCPLAKKINSDSYLTSRAWTHLHCIYRPTTYIQTYIKKRSLYILHSFLPRAFASVRPVYYLCTSCCALTYHIKRVRRCIPSEYWAPC